MPSYRADKSFADELDAGDPLRSYRDRFHFPLTCENTPKLYLCGNSLGLQPREARAAVEQEMNDWERLAVEGHMQANHPWMTYHELLAESTGRLVGADPSEVVVMNSLSVNLHLMMVSFYRPTASRYKILVEASAFPSDRYAIQSQLQFRGFGPSEAVVEVSPRPGETAIRTEDIESLLEKEGRAIALILLGGVNYLSGQAFDMERITKAGHAQGCVVGFDLAHATGNIPLELNKWNVDFAVWCSYKYLNAGPGAVGGCFVHQRHAHDRSLPRFTGWWGQNKETRFLMDGRFEPMDGAEGWQISNAPILSMATLRSSMKIFDETGMQRLRAKSIMLTGYLEFLLNQMPSGAITLLTPKDPSQRGCQLSLSLPRNGKEVFTSLSSKGVVCDWREPNAIRVAPVPLYNSFKDVFSFAEILRGVL